MAYRSIGKSQARVEGYGKVTGQTKYAADLAFEGLLWAKVLRSSMAHARIVSVDTARAKALPGVHAAHGHAQRFLRSHQHYQLLPPRNRRVEQVSAQHQAMLRV